jgi:protein-S-isoprenylcysteine O-methyltransferase Ste14
MTPYLAAAMVLILCWVALAVMLVRARIRARRGAGAEGSTRKRDLQSWLGLGLQGVGFSIAWSVHRPEGASWLPGMTPALDWLLAGFAALLAIASTAFAGAAIRTLDKQWSLTARVRGDHELIRHGPFARVRHPIYSALLGLLVATAFCLALWWALPLGAAVYLLGTRWRTSREERLLTEMFGSAYDDYRRDVPWLLPRFSFRV